MAYSFGDGYDCYAAFTDAFAGYWDSGAGTPTLVAGRFAGSQALRVSATATNLTKSSGQNDAVHHIVVAFRQTATLTGSTLGLYFQLLDATTGQCCVVFRSDGAILLTSGTPAGAVLDTYTGAVTAANTWFAFEFEVVINNTTGSWAVRKNGNTVNDRALGSLNTRPGANSYANKLTIGMQALLTAHEIDDTFWQSGTSAGTFLGDIRAYTRMPASDAAVQFARSIASNTQTLTATAANSAMSPTVVRFTPYTMTYDGTISSVVAVSGTSASGNMKCAIYASAAGLPTTVLQSATAPVVTVAAGNNTFTFSPPVAATKGQQIFIAVINDTGGGSWSWSSSFTTLSAPGTYATFPQPNPAPTLGQNPIAGSITYNTSVNAGMVNEAQQDGTTSYVYDSTVNDADFYTIAPIAVTPISVVAVTTRAFMAKSDAGTRTGTVQIKSGATTVAAPTLSLATSFLWAWRTDTTDPATGTAWTAAAVNAAQCGPKVVA